MLDNERLRLRLGELVRSRRAAPAGEVRDGDPGTERAALATGTGAMRAGPLGGRREEGVGVEDFLPGGEWRDEHGAVYVHERLRSVIERRRPHWGRLGNPPADEPQLASLAAAGLSRALFLDLETGGLASSPGCPAGTLHSTGQDFGLR